jgi:predicted GIY-YIG superfamily endonuclease
MSSSAVAYLPDGRDATSEPVEIEIGDEFPTALYRLYAVGDVLLYVGFTGELKSRFGQHAKTQPWWPEVVRKTVAWYPTRAEADAAETAAIDREKPVHNISKSGRWWRLSEWRILPYDDEVGVDPSRLIALGLDKSISPTALKLAVIYLGGYTTEYAVEALNPSRSSFFQAIRELKAAGHVDAWLRQEA